MARTKKNAAPIVGSGKDPENKLTVQKSLPLFSLWRSDMTLAEFKILDTYLSRINSHDPDRRSVVFTKGELEQLLGVKKINKPDLAARLKGLGRFVDLEDKNTKKIHQVALFEEAYGEMDENGQWTVRITCTAKAMKYVFNVEKLGYLRYKLRCITSLTSRYTYVLFIYLEANRFRKTWEVDLNELRQVLNCDTEESYNEFKLFNNRILKRCQKELLEKTECRFTYEPVKTGRKVTGVRFTLETLADTIEPDEIPGQLSLVEFEDDGSVQDIPDMNDPLAIYIETLQNVDLTREQVDVLQQMAKKVVPYEYDPLGAMPYECKVADYLLLQVAKMKASKRKISHPYEYLMKLIQNDANQ